jgi:hypothetical protein
VIDIVSIGEGPGGDLTTFDAQTSKAANVLSVQLGNLEYAPDFGIDIEFFIQEDFQFQMESFRSYLIQRLSEHHVNVNQVIDLIESLSRKFTFVVGDADKSTGGFIR